jgi:broad specificity phosphatase PhoE
MATLYVIRHGQASFGQADYDRLSPKGWQQGRALGQWLGRFFKPGILLQGEMRRHRETLDAMLETCNQAWPERMTLAGLNEFDHMNVLHCYRPAWRDRLVMMAELAAAEHPGKTFQRHFSAAIARWSEGQHDAEYHETWAHFRERVIAAMEQCIELAKGEDALIITSGGPIAVIMQHLLGLSDATALDLTERIANTSVTQVLYRGPRRSLEVFNNYSHLQSIHSLCQAENPPAATNTDTNLLTFR